MKTFLISATAATILATSAFAGSHGGAVPGAKFLDEWDQNADGQVTVEEAASRRSDIFASFDENNDGVLSAEEYAFFDAARENAHGADAGNGGERKAAAGFTLAFNDVDGDGSVTLEEFLGKSADWLALLDRNGDGVVTKDDFGPMG